MITEQELTDFVLWIELETEFEFTSECWRVDNEIFYDGLSLYKHWKEKKDVIPFGTKRGNN